MNRRGFFRDLLVAFAASTALAKHALAIVDDDPADGWLIRYGADTDWLAGTPIFTATVTFRLKATAADGAVSLSDWTTLEYPVRDGVLQIGPFKETAQIQQIIIGTVSGPQRVW